MSRRADREHPSVEFASTRSVLTFCYLVRFGFFSAFLFAEESKITTTLAKYQAQFQENETVQKVRALMALVPMQLLIMGFKCLRYSASQPPLSLLLVSSTVAATFPSNTHMPPLTPRILRTFDRSSQ
jgi:hypothetical protein